MFTEELFFSEKKKKKRQMYAYFIEGMYAFELSDVTLTPSSRLFTYETRILFVEHNINFDVD